MMNSKMCRSLAATSLVLLLGGNAFAQEEIDRKPIKEVPVETKPEVPEVEVKKPEVVVPPEAEAKAKASVESTEPPVPTKPEKEPEPEVRKGSAASQPISIEDTLFAPVNPGQMTDLGSIPASAPDTPVDASTIEIAAVAPKDAQLELMQVYEGLRQWDNAIAAGNLVLKRDPKNKEALAGMSRLMVETGRSAEALEYAEQVMRLEPGMKSKSLKAAALMSATRVEEAEALLLEMKAGHKMATPFPFETLLGFAKLDQGKKKEARSIFETINSGSGYDLLEVDTARKQLILMDLDHAVEWRDIESAKASVAKLRDEYKGEPETAAAEAVELFLEGDAKEAAARLAALRTEFPRLRLYPFLVQLADFSYEAGDFETAEAAYAEALADARTRPLARQAIVRNWAQMRVREGGEAAISHGIVSGEEGSLSTSAIKVRKSINEHWYFGAEVTRQDINLDGNTGVRGGEDRMEALLVAEKRLKKGRYAEIKVGGYEGGATGGVTVGKRPRVYSDAWTVGVAVSERANDSAQLAAVDGRQHRVSATYQREINPRTVISAEAIARRVEVDGNDLGNGASIDIDLAYRLNEEGRNNNFFVAWRSTYAKFKRSGWMPSGSAYDESVIDELGVDQFVAGLVQPEYSRHGVEVRHEGQWNETLFTRAVAGLYYRSDNSDVEVSAGVGVDWFFKDDMRLFFDALYTSSGRAGNSGAGVAEAKVGVAKSF